MPEEPGIRISDGAGCSIPHERAMQICEIARGFYQRGWVLGTSGNFSSVLSRDPLRLAITSSGVDKGLIGPKDVLEVDEDGSVVSGAGRPSAETLLHIKVA